MARNVLAFDLGASSGRAILCAFDGGKVTLTEALRFENRSVQMRNQLLWDAPGLFAKMCDGLAAASRLGGIDALGIDTWGVDFALLDRHEQLIGNPVCYRDVRTDGIMEKAFNILPRERIAELTGLAFLQFNTLYQLYAMRMRGDPQLDTARDLLLMPDFLSWLFCGEKGAEYTHASTTQLIDPYSRGWSGEIMDAFGLNRTLFQSIQQPGTKRGVLLQTLRRELGTGAVPVISVASHDTASAVAAVPALDENIAYISSGTWSLVGLETPSPVISPEQCRYNITNEGGVFGTTRLLCNVMGLWIIQECRREWERQGMSRTFPQLCDMAGAEEPFLAVIDPDDNQFLYPGDMPAKVAAYCEKTGQSVPQTPAQVARVVFESLALRYRLTVDRLREVSGRPISAMYIVGGGANNRLLNGFTADALGMAVYAGPGEATALGNCLMQLYALGEAENLPQMRDIVRRSFPPEEVLPSGGTAAWEDKLDEALNKGWIS